HIGPHWKSPPDPLMRPGQNRAEEWAFVTELKRDFTIKEVPMIATRIDDDVKVLLVAHPVEISDAAQYVIDQFNLLPRNTNWSMAYWPIRWRFPMRPNMPLTSSCCAAAN